MLDYNEFAVVAFKNSMPPRVRSVLLVICKLDYANDVFWILEINKEY